MNAWTHPRSRLASGAKARACFRALPAWLKPHLFTVAAAMMLALAATAAWTQSPAPVVLDRVVAVINKQAILESDLDDEIQLSVLDVTAAGEGKLTRRHALEQLISRTLVEQQIAGQDAEAAEPTPAEVEARVSELRRELPACVHANCATDAGWKAFLAKNGLTVERVDAYMRYRLQILGFIERRFRPGIRISQQEIEHYYDETLVPQYGAGETPPPLDEVAPRIEEILLEQQVNVLFGQWLTNLRSQGDVEILDPDLRPTDQDPSAGTPALHPADQDPSAGAPALRPTDEETTGKPAAGAQAENGR